MKANMNMKVISTRQLMKQSFLTTLYKNLFPPNTIHIYVLVRKHNFNKDIDILYLK